MKIDSSIKDSVTLKFSELAREKNRKKERIISLGIGEPDFATPQPIIEATYEAMQNGYTKYSNPSGLVELRELIKKKLLTDNNINTSIDNIIITPGAKQALLLALMAILKPHDEVINITPCYVSYIPQIKIAEPDAIIHNVDLKKENFSLDWKDLGKKLNKKTKAFIINFPHNPTGKMLLKEEVEELVKLLKESACYIISDEIYEKLNFSNSVHYSIGAFDEVREKVITVNGFSKAFSMTGWRIGYLTANSEIINIISKLQQHINTNTCTFIQKGTCAAFSLSSDYLDSYKDELREKASFAATIFNSNERLKLNSPMGGLFAFINISKTGLSSDAFSSELLLKMGVAVTPGIAFGDAWDDHVRISFVAPKKDFEEGIRLIDKFSNELKPGK